MLSGFSDFILPRLSTIALPLHGANSEMVLSQRRRDTCGLVGHRGITEGFLFSVWPRFTCWFSDPMLDHQGIS